MADITTRDILIAALGAAQQFGISKAPQASEGAGTWSSIWKAAGYPAAGANPPLFSAGSGYVPTKATTGALPFVNASAGDLLRMLHLSMAANVIGTLIIADRVWACSGFGTVVTTAQNITTPGNIGRDNAGGTDGVGVELWGEVYTAPGATAATWTATATDVTGTTGRTWTYAHPANAETVGQMFPFLPGGGTPGAMHVRSPTSFTCSVSSGTAGDIGLTCLRRLVTIPSAVANMAALFDALALGMRQVHDNSCLMFMFQNASTSSAQVVGNLALGEP